MATLVPYVALTALHSLLLKHLARSGASTPETLLAQGLGCLLLAAVLARRAGASLRPTAPRLQALRLVTSGLALGMLTGAYQYANATTVAVIARMDTALLVVAGPWIGVAVTRTQQGLACACVALLAGLATSAGGTGEAGLGYLLAVLGTLGVTAGYLLLRSAAKAENIYVVAGVAGLALTIYGGLGALASGAAPAPGLAHRLPLGLLAGGAMFEIYRLTVRLYAVMDIARAEYPTLFAALLVLPAEWYLFGTGFTPAYVASILANLAILGAILAARPPEPPPAPGLAG